MAILNSLNKYKLLLGILLVASVLRLWNLQNIPPHLRNDEAALGYNVYSILNTGNDEHGEFLPIILQSFGDWKMGLYAYLTIPFIAILGLNELAIRLPSAFAGILAVLLIYNISLELFQKKRIAYISAFLLAISPLFMPFSRGAWEVNVSLTLTLAGIYFFLISLKKNNFFLLLSAIFFGLTLICSHGAKFSTPAILAILISVFFKQFKKIPRRIFLLSFLTIILFSIPVVLSFAQGKVTRLTTLSIFSYPQDFTKAILSRWMSLYSIKTIFVKGDLNPQHGAPDMGPFLLMDALFLLLGFVKMIRIGFTKQTFFILSLLFLLALPSALTIEKANFERVITLFIPFIIIEALGINVFWEKARKKRWLLTVVIALYITNYIYFLDQYLIHGPKKNDAWQYGYKQIVEKVTPLQAKYQQIVVQQSLEQPYIFFLFYQKYDPEKYQKNVKEVFVPNKEDKDMGLVSRVENVQFVDIDWSIMKPASGMLYVMPVYKLEQQSKYYSSYKFVDEIKDLNGFPLFKIIETI